MDTIAVAHPIDIEDGIPAMRVERLIEALNMSLPSTSVEMLSDRGGEFQPRMGGQAQGPAPTSPPSEDGRRDRPAWRSAFSSWRATGGPSRRPALTTAPTRDCGRDEALPHHLLLVEGP